MLPAAFGPGARRREPSPRSRRCALVGGAPSGSPRPRTRRGLRLSRYAAGRAGSRPGPFSRAVGLRAARPLAARAATPTRRPPRRRSGPPGVRGSRSLRPGPAVPSTVDALPLCPLLPGWPPGGRSAPGSRAPGRRGSPRRSRRRRSGPGGPRGAAAATGRLGRRCRPARAPGPLFLCFCCGFRPAGWARGQKYRKWCKNGRKTAKNGKNSCKTYMSQV